MFVFQNNFWVNLHQFLRGEIYRRRVNAPPGVDPASLGEADRAAWASALDVYTGVSTHDLIFDAESQRRNARPLNVTGSRTWTARHRSRRRCTISFGTQR